MSSWGCSVIAPKSFKVCNELLPPLGSAERRKKSALHARVGAACKRAPPRGREGEDWIVFARGVCVNLQEQLTPFSGTTANPILKKNQNEIQILFANACAISSFFLWCTGEKSCCWMQQRCKTCFDRSRSLSTLQFIRYH